MDCSAVVAEQHLEAALALWDYCEASAAYIFGEATGDPIADRILSALRNAGGQGLSSTDISNLLGRNERSARIAAALTDLEQAHLVVREVGDSTDQGGRRPTLWRAVVP
jgi:hypothetical protein